MKKFQVEDNMPQKLRDVYMFIFVHNISSLLYMLLCGTTLANPSDNFLWFISMIVMQSTHIYVSAGN